MEIGSIIMDNSFLGKRIKEYRIKEQMTQLMLAEKTGLCEDAIYSYENSKMIPGSEAIILISNALNVSPDVLLCDYLHKSSTIKSDNIMRRLSRLPVSEQNRLLRIMDELINDTTGSIGQ